MQRGKHVWIVLIFVHVLITFPYKNNFNLKDSFGGWLLHHFLSLHRAVFSCKNNCFLK